MVESRRVCFRRSVALRVDYTTAHSGPFLGLTRNLSLQGMYLEDVGHVAPGDLLTAVFVLPTGQPCKLQAAVVRQDAQGCGVQFQHFHSQSLIHFIRYWACLD
jgi:PilZ domain